MADIRKLQSELQSAIAVANDEVALQKVRSDYLGKKGKLTALLKKLASLAPEKRAKQGAELNQIKQQAMGELNDKLNAITKAESDRLLEEDTTDISLPNYGHGYGGWHPISSTRKRIEMIFHQAGYETMLGPEIEDDYHNFEALNFPPQHPARSEHDTFYFGDGRLLRTHTSPTQIRSMKSKQPPIRVICPGKTYRCDYDATHSPMFNQVEGMLIDKAVRFSDLKGTLQAFINGFFAREIPLRFRTSYFPFVEPGAEVDILWEEKSRASGEDKWMEILGCGMVHPNVLRHGGIDPAEYSGFAFGLGIERMAMLYYGINDIRLFYENDMRFLKQFV